MCAYHSAQLLHNCRTQHSTEHCSVNLPSYPPNNHHCSGAVYWRRGAAGRAELGRDRFTHVHFCTGHCKLSAKITPLHHKRVPTLTGEILLVSLWTMAPFYRHPVGYIHAYIAVVPCQNKIILKNFRPEPPPSVDRRKVILFQHRTTSEMK